MPTNKCGGPLTDDQLRDTPVPVDIAQEGLIERIIFNTLKRLNVDASGRLRISAESVASHAVTLASTVVSSITTWGLSTTTAKAQWESNLQYQSGFRRNLVKTA